MTYHPQVERLLARSRAAPSPPLYTLTVEEARAADLASIRSAGGTPEPVARVVEGHIPEADVTRIAVGGDSAGGNLAAAVSLLVRDRGGPRLTGQLLVYPNTDYPPPPPPADVDPLLFNELSVRWYWQNYLADEADGHHPLAAPMQAGDLRDLPPALAVTAEHDPLCDEGERYASRLAHDGVPVEVSRYGGMIHGFFTMLGELDASRAAVAEAAEFLRGTWEPNAR